MSMASLVQQAEAVAAGTVAYLEQLPPEGWTRPSDCAGWSVADLVAHLVLVEALLSSSMTRGLQGDSGPMPAAIDGLEAWRAYRAREIARLGAMPPAELLARFRDGLEPIREALARVQAADDTSMLGWHPSAGPQPVSWFPGQWLVELALHDWDLRAAADPEATVNPTAYPALGPEMRSRMPRCYKPASSGNPTGVVRIDLPGSTAWLARIADGKIELLEEGAAEPDATIRTDAGSYALAQTARRPAAHFKERGRWETDGDAALPEHLEASFVGY